MFTEENFFQVASTVIMAHLPVMIIEGLIAAFCVGFLKKVSPELLPGWDADEMILPEKSPEVAEGQV